MPPLSLLLQQATARLAAGPHPERARRDAEMLLQYQLGKNRAWLLAHLDDNLGGCSAVNYAATVERRAKGEPIQYITGEAEFYGLSFHVTPEVLIPRPETEHLVERAAELAREMPAPRIVDIGTGSGAIAVSLAHLLKSKSITAIDISEPALQVARGNAERNGVDIRFLRGDLLQPVAGEAFDIVVSNPPYVPTPDRPTLSVEVREHEPALALFAGDDGLDIYRRLIPAAFAALVPGGHLLMEIGYSQQPSIEALLAEAGFNRIEFVPDLQGIARVASARRP